MQFILLDDLLVTQQGNSVLEINDFMAKMITDDLKYLNLNYLCCKESINAQAPDFSKPIFLFNYTTLESVRNKIDVSISKINKLLRENFELKEQLEAKHDQDILNQKQVTGYQSLIKQLEEQVVQNIKLVNAYKEALEKTLKQKDEIQQIISNFCNMNLTNLQQFRETNQNLSHNNQDIQDYFNSFKALQTQVQSQDLDQNCLLKADELIKKNNIYIERIDNNILNQENQNKILLSHYSENYKEQHVQSNWEIQQLCSECQYKVRSYLQNIETDIQKNQIELKQENKQLKQELDKLKEENIKLLSQMSQNVNSVVIYYCINNNYVSNNASNKH